MSLIVSRGLGKAGNATYPSCLAFLATSVIADTEKVTIVFTSAVSLITGPGADPAQYILTALDGGKAVTVTAVAIVGDNLVLTTTPQSDGKTYNLTMPDLGIIDPTSNPFSGPFDNEFLGVGLPLVILMARPFDARLLDVYFNQAVTEADALDPTNYSITPTLTVSAVEKVTDSVYRLTTSRQTKDTAYTVSATVSTP